MLDELEPEQFNEWIAADRLDPIGLERLYQVLALIGSTLSGPRYQKPIPPHLFIPGQKEHEQSPEEMIELCRNIAAQQNGSLQ